MSTSDPNSTAPPPLTTVSSTPTIHSNTFRTPIPPLPPPSFRGIPLAQPPIRRPNSDQSPIMYPFPYPGSGLGRGFRTVPMSYNQRQFGIGQAQVESVMQLMRARNPQFSHPGSGSTVGSGHMTGVPHFMPPRVVPPPTAMLDPSRNKHVNGSGKRASGVVSIRGRKVKITDEASLYSLGRSWLRNGAHEGIQMLRSDTMKPLPKPLPVDKMEASVPNGQAQEPTDEDKEDAEAVRQLSEKDLLKRHVERAKKVRARLKEERLRKIARYKTRLALLLPQPGE